ncbi:MAG: CopG family transcriptional regulator [Thermoleophilaceae bacterium]|nr:CopG family transcriptional regulator [Thermoleophilaceae bacterium]
MRTTVTLADDVAAAVERLRSEHTIGVSQAVNQLVRAGLAAQPQASTFVQRTHSMGEGFVDVTNVWEAIEAAETPAAR